MRRILHELVGATPRHVCTFSCQNIRTSGLRLFNIKQDIAKKTGSYSTLKPFHIKGKMYLTQLYAQKSSCPRRF